MKKIKQHCSEILVGSGVILTAFNYFLQPGEKFLAQVLLVVEKVSPKYIFCQ